MKTRRHLNSFRYIFIIAIILFSMCFTRLAQGLQASVINTDSLRELIARHPSDKKAVDAMLAMATDLRSVYSYDSARIYADSALAVSNRINYQEGIVNSSLLIFNFQWLVGQLNEAQATIPRLIHITQQFKEKDKLALAYYHVGVVYRLIGALDSAIYYFKASMALESKDTLNIISANIDMGSVFIDLAEYDSSIYYRVQAARLAELSGNEESLGIFYGDIGAIFMYIKEYDEAEKYFKMGIEISRKYNNVSSTANILTGLGEIFFYQGDNTNALASLDEANELFKSIGITNRTDLFLDYALIFETQGKYDQALEYCKKSLKINKDENDVAWIMRSLSTFGHIYTKMGKNELARAYLDSAITIAIEKGYRHDQMDLMKLQAVNSFTVGKFEQAYKEFGTFFNLYDSINAGKAKALTELKHKYEKEKYQAQILSLEKESLKRKLQRNLVLFNSSALIVAALFFLVILRHKLVKTKLISVQKIMQLEEEKKIMMARNLVEGQEEERKRIAGELHDGLGVLLSAARMQLSQVMEKIPDSVPLLDKAIHLVEQSSGEARRISHNMMPGLLTRLGLFEAVEDLVDNINEMEMIRASCIIEGEPARLPEKMEIMLYRIFQEMINNTLKYARASNIELKIRIAHPLLTISYRDDGIGFDLETTRISANKSLGLKSIESRVDFLNGELKIESAPGKGVVYLIKVPI